MGWRPMEGETMSKQWQTRRDAALAFEARCRLAPIYICATPARWTYILPDGTMTSDPEKVVEGSIPRVCVETLPFTWTHEVPSTLRGVRTQWVTNDFVKPIISETLLSPVLENKTTVYLAPVIKSMPVTHTKDEFDTNGNRRTKTITETMPCIEMKDGNMLMSPGLIGIAIFHSGPKTYLYAMYHLAPQSIHINRSRYVEQTKRLQQMPYAERTVEAAKMSSMLPGEVMLIDLAVATKESIANCFDRTPYLMVRPKPANLQDVEPPPFAEVEPDTEPVAPKVRKPRVRKPKQPKA